jgi:riboflavin kinase/FMN adenylyltransferase/tyrosyl-tRNA synthetase
MQEAELNYLLKRGVAEIIVEDEMAQLLRAGKKLRLKEGFDPSFPDIHLGHMVALRKLRQFQERGHQIVLIVADWTAQIGDPSGMSATRPMLTMEEVKANAETYMQQFFTIVDKAKTEIRWQSEWFGKFDLSDILTDIERRTELLKDEGVDEVIPLSFTPELAKLSPKEFLELLKKHLRMRGLVIGPDFALGHNREGNTNVLRQLGTEMDFSLTVLPPLTIDGEVVSSTAIRKALAEGDMKRAQKLMGRPFRLHGRVVKGERRGVELGFPTANLDTEAEQALPADGVYTSRAYIDDRAYPAMANIGLHPTFGGDKRLVEVYLMDYRGDDIYGRELTVEIIERLRDEIKFDSPEELKKQIAKDVKRGKASLEIRGGS